MRLIAWQYYTEDRPDLLVDYVCSYFYLDFLQTKSFLQLMWFISVVNLNVFDPALTK